MSGGTEVSRSADEQSARSALHEATLAGVRWVALTRLVSEVVAFGSMIVLAHLIAPAEFGRAAVALIVNGLAIVVAGGGFGAPLVQRADIQRAHLESAQLASLACGIALSATTFLLAPIVCGPIFGSEIEELVRLMSPVFVVASLGVVSQSILQRRLDFRRLSLIEMAAVTSGSLSALAFAAGAGLDAEAILLGVMVTAATLAVLQQACTPLILPRWHGRALREIVAFGLPAAGSSLVTVLNRNVDYAILAARLAPAQVGYYWRAFQFGVEYQRKVSGILMRIGLPIYARAATPQHRRELRSRIVRAQTTVIFPLLALFIAIAPTLIPWMLGSRWEPSVLPTQILALAGMASSVLTGLGPLMLAAGRPRALLAYNLGSVTAFALTILLVSPFGLVATCVAVTGFYAVQLLAAHWLLLDRLLEIPFREVVSDIAPAAVASIPLVLVALPLSRALDAQAVPTPIQLFLTASAAAATYLFVLRFAFRSAWADLATLAARGLRRRQSSSKDSTVLSPAAP